MQFMKIIHVVLYCFLLLLCSFSTVMAQDWGEIREATANLNVRDKRSAQGAHVVTLAKNQRVKVDFLKDNWFAVFNLNEKVRDLKNAVGFANAAYLVPVNEADNNSVTGISGIGEIKAGVVAQPETSSVTGGIGTPGTPVNITSDRMIYDEAQKTVSFVGNVIAVHGELNLWAEKLTAYLTTTQGSSLTADSIERIVAKGNVRAEKGTAQGSCNKLTYFVSQQLLKMEGNPKLQDGPNSLSGNIINYYARENRSEVISGEGKRVRAVFTTPEGVQVP